MKYLKVLVVFAFSILTGISVVRAYTDNPNTPPTCPTSIPGCNEPINVSATNQVKDGGLGLGGNFSVLGRTILGGGYDAATLNIAGISRDRPAAYIFHNQNPGPGNAGLFLDTTHSSNPDRYHIYANTSGSAVFSVKHNGDVAANRFCLNGDCRGVWPSGSGGGGPVLGINAGTGILVNSQAVSGVQVETISNRLGGMYSTKIVRGIPIGCDKVNPLTGGCNCPSNYTAHEVLSTGSLLDEIATLYLCVR